MSRRPTIIKTAPTPVEAAAIDKLARAMEPDAWSEYDAGNGTCANEDGWKCIDSIIAAKRLIRAFPAIVQAVT